MKKSLVCAALCAVTLTVPGEEILNSSFRLPSGVATAFRVFSTSRDLRFVIRCEEPSMDQLKAEGKIHDVSVWKGDHVELFIAPLRTKDAIVQLAVSPLGAVYDAKVMNQIRDPEWNIPALEVKSTRSSDHWTVDVTIPLAALMSILPARSDQGKVTADSWSFHLVRTRRSARNESGSFRKCSHNLDLGSYAPLKAVKGDFKILRWAMEALKVSSVEMTGMDSCRVTVQGAMENLTSSMREVTAQTFLSTPRKRQIFPGKEQWLLLDKKQTFTLKEVFTLPSCGTYLLEWIARDPEGVLCCVAEELSIRYEPMALQIVQGAWRGKDIFSSMKQETLSFRLQSNVPYRPGKQEKCFLTIREDGRSKVLLQKVYPAFRALTEVLKVKLPAKKAASYLCRVTFSGGKIPGCSTVYTIHPPAENELYIGENGNFVRNGKEFFPIGAFNSWAAFVPEKEKALSDFTVVYGPLQKLDARKEQAIREVYRQEKSMKLIYPEPPSLWSHPAAKGGTLRSSRPIPPENERSIASRIRQYRGKTYIGGWYLTDEPNERVCLPDYYKKINEICHREDPYHPTFMTFNAVAPAKIYGEFCDTAFIDFFPGFHEKGVQRSLDYIAPMLQEASKVMKGKSLIAGPPLYAYANGSLYPARFATYREMVCMVYSSLTCKAVRGIAWNDASRLGVTADFYFGLPVLVRNLKKLEKFLLSTETFPVSFTGKGSSKIQWIAKTVKGSTWILVVNPSGQPLTVESPRLRGNALHELLNRKEWDRKGGTLTLEGLEVCLFTDETETPELITLREVEEKIAAFRKKELSSGNYCYYRTGSDVLYSPQYTAGGKSLSNPFIRRVLINGLPTWFLHNAPAPGVDKDPYLGVRFPGKRTVGRIRVAWVNRLRKEAIDPADVLLEGSSSGEDWKPLKVLRQIRHVQGDFIQADYILETSSLRAFRLRFRKKRSAALMSPCELKAFAR